MQRVNLLRGFIPGSKPELKPVVNEWQKAIERMTQEWIIDVPWWYGERPSIGIFASAVTLCRGWAFEEYQVFRQVLAKQKIKKQYGRCDLTFGFRDIHYVAEAKQCWPVIGNNARNPWQVINENLQQARLQVAQIHEHTVQRLGMVFAVPRLLASSDESVEDRLRSLIQMVTSAGNRTVAWVFPESARKIQPSNRNYRYYYPGVILIIK